VGIEFSRKGPRRPGYLFRSAISCFSNPRRSSDMVGEGLICFRAA
jgi:hypothetical protein